MHSTGLLTSCLLAGAAAAIGVPATEAEMSVDWHLRRSQLAEPVSASCVQAVSFPNLSSLGLFFSVFHTRHMKLRIPLFRQSSVLSSLPHSLPHASTTQRTIQPLLSGTPSSKKSAQRAASNPPPRPTSLSFSKHSSIAGATLPSRAAATRATRATPTPLPALLSTSTV